MSFLITGSEYTELKNSAIRNLYKTAKKNNKSIVIHKNPSKIAIKSMCEQNDKILYLFIKSYREFLKQIFNPNLIICYMDVAFQKNILLFCGDFEKVVYNLIKKNNDPYVERNICLEKNYYRILVIDAHLLVVLIVKKKNYLIYVLKMKLNLNVQYAKID